MKKYRRGGPWWTISVVRLALHRVNSHLLGLTTVSVFCVLSGGVRPMASNEDVLFHLHTKQKIETHIQAAAVRERAGGGDLDGGDIAVIAVAVRNGRVIVDIRSGGGGVGVTHRAQH